MLREISLRRAMETEFTALVPLRIEKYAARKEDKSTRKMIGVTIIFLREIP